MATRVALSTPSVRSNRENNRMSTAKTIGRISRSIRRSQDVGATR